MSNLDVRPAPGAGPEKVNEELNWVQLQCATWLPIKAYTKDHPL